MRTQLFKRMVILLLTTMPLFAFQLQAATGSMTIGGTLVPDLSANASGTGWTWTAGTATLTLTNSYTASPIGINCGNSETVNLVYNGNVSVTSNSSSAISCVGSLNISGSNGTLTVTSSSSSSLYCAIEVLGALGISSGIINATCAGSGTDPSAAVIYGSGGVTVSGSSNVTATATGNDASSIYVEQGNITISTSGTVAANGKGAGSAINLRNGHTLDMSSGSLALTGNSLDGNRYSALNITGGNITIGGTPVYKAILTLSGVTTEAEVTSVSSPAVGYGISSKKTSSDGKLCFLLPQGSQTVTLVAGGKTYTGTVNVATNHTTTGTLAAQNGLSNDATLLSLTVSVGTLTPAFSAATTNYTVSVANIVTSIIIGATANHTGASISGDTGTKNLNVGENPFTITVTAEDGTTKDYMVTVTRAAVPVLSSDATLSSLTVSTGTLSPAFSAATTNYTVSVANTVTSITIGATANHTGASISGDTGTKNLNVGENPFTITVTAEDGTTKDYMVTVTRAAVPVLSSDATLSSLTVSTGTLSPAFSAATTNYTVSVANTVTSITIGATANHTGASISGDTGTKNLNVGENPFTIRVTAEDGTTTKEYNVVVTRETSTVGIENMTQKGMQIYPNPATSQLIVENEKGRIDDVITIFDLTGKPTIIYNATSEKNTIDVSKLNKGIYFIQIGRKHIMKFIKN